MDDGDVRSDEPEESHWVEEIGLAALKGAVGAIPVVGPALAEFTGVAVKAGVGKKNHAFLMALNEQVRDIEDRLNLRTEEIFANPEFQSYLTRAIIIAWETYEEEKIRALARAAVRSGPWHGTGRSEKEFYWGLLRRYSADHLVILKVLHRPAILWEDWGLPIEEIPLHAVFQELLGFPAHHDEIGQAILITLYQDQLTESGYGLGYSFVPGEGRSRLTTLGGGLVQFYAQEADEAMSESD